MAATVLILMVAWPRTEAPAAPAQVISISPANGALLSGAPSSVELVLSGDVDVSLSHVTVRDSAGTTVNTGEVSQIAGEPLRQPVRTDASGDFTIAYHVILTDGREVTGWTNFSVNTGVAPANPAVAPEVDDGGHSHGVDPIGAALLVVNAFVLIGVFIMLRIRPKPVRPDNR